MNNQAKRRELRRNSIQHKQAKNQATGCRREVAGQEKLAHTSRQKWFWNLGHRSCDYLYRFWNICKNLNIHEDFANIHEDFTNIHENSRFLDEFISFCTAHVWFFTYTDTFKYSVFCQKNFFIAEDDDPTFFYWQILWASNLIFDKQFDYWQKLLRNIFLFWKTIFFWQRFCNRIFFIDE